MIIKFNIVGAGLILRPLCSTDASERYLSWFNDPEVTKFIEARRSAPYTIESLVQFIRENNESPETLLLGIFLHQDGSHIGNIRLSAIDSYHHSAEIGILIGERTQWEEDTGH